MADAAALRTVTVLASCAISALWLAFFGKIAWRNRRNRFLFFGWTGVLIVFILVYVMIFANYIRAWK